MGVIKAVHFRLIDPRRVPITWAFIKAELVPDVTYGERYNTIFPKEAQTRTNEYGMATLLLEANDALDIPESKYLITITKDGKTYKFLVRLTVDMPDSIDFEELLNRKEQARRAKECADPGEAGGRYFIIGDKLYI